MNYFFMKVKSFKYVLNYIHWYIGGVITCSVYEFLILVFMFHIFCMLYF